MILFAKYSNERRRSLRIRTEIAGEDGSVIVRKLPQSEEARGHIRALVQHGEDLARLTEGSRFVPNRVRLSGDAAEFEYLNGPTLEEQFDGLLSDGDEALLSAFDAYFQALSSLCDTEFCATEEFRTVFGEARVQTGLPAMSVSDIDLVLNNIIVTGETWVIIDYEWTFDFPVPLPYIKWRILHYYLTGNSKRLGLDRALYMKHAGITEEEEASYEAMEKCFQSYVNGDYVPRRDLYGAVSDGVTDVYNLVRGYEGTRIASVYPDGGEGCTEDTRVTAKVAENGEVSFRIPVPGVLQVRIDHLESPCFVENLKAVCGGENIDLSELKTDGVLVEGSGLFFTDADPQIEVPLPENAEGFLEISFKVTSLDRLDPSRMSLGNAALRDEIRIMRDACIRKDAVLANRLALAGEIRGQRSEKILRKAMRLAGRKDPFALFHPILASDPEGLCVTIDAVSAGASFDRIRGWCFDRAFSAETIRVRNAAGEEIPFSVRRAPRPDVTDMFGLSPLRAAGFTVDIPLDGKADGRYVFEVENLRGIFRCEVRTAEDPAERADLVRRGTPAITRDAYEKAQMEEVLQVPDVTEEDLAAFSEQFTVVTGEWDTLKAGAREHAAAFFKKNPETDVIYWDDGPKTWDDRSSEPYYKPDFNLSYLRSAGYIGSCFAVRKELLQKSGVPAPVNAEDFFDLLLHLSEHTDRFGHIPHVLSTRSGPGLFEMSDLKVCAAHLRAHYVRCGVMAQVREDAAYRILRTEYDVPREPLISVLIPNKDHAADLTTAVDSVMRLGGWKNLEIIVIENNSREEETFRTYGELSRRYPCVRVITYEGAFNYSAVNDLGVRESKGEYLLFLNNDTEVIEEGSVRKLAAACMQEGAGAAGARMYFGDDTVQHAGVIIGYGGFAGHCFSGAMRGAEGYMKRIVAQMELSAVTAACMMVKKSVYEEAGGFDPSYAVALNDIDLCLKIREAGYRIFYEPGAVLYHYESRSRGYEVSQEQKERFASEIARFRERWKEILQNGDPFYNSNLTLARPDFSLKP